MSFGESFGESSWIGEAEGEGGRLHGRGGLLGAESDGAGEGAREGTRDVVVVSFEAPGRKMGSKEGLVGAGEMIFGMDAVSIVGICVLLLGISKSICRVGK